MPAGACFYLKGNLLDLCWWNFGIFLENTTLSDSLEMAKRGFAAQCLLLNAKLFGSPASRRRFWAVLVKMGAPTTSLDFEGSPLVPLRFSTLPLHHLFQSTMTNSDCSLFIMLGQRFQNMSSSCMPCVSCTGLKFKV